ncbi:MAG TPA: thioredoxin domain-containing protein [Jiangellaceae bacterium]
MSQATKQKVAAQRAKERAQEQRRRRARWLSMGAVAVVVGAGLIGVAQWESSKPTDVAVPASATMDGAGLPVGTGPVTVELYLDFLCPACRQFDAAARPVLDQFLADDAIELVYRPIAILDRATTTKFSTRAASAAGCASDEGKIDEFVAVMMANQPAEGTTGLSDDQIVQLGTSAGLDGATFGQCVADGTYTDWAGENTNTAVDRGVQGTPTVYVDGEQLTTLSVDELIGAIENAG